MEGKARLGREWQTPQDNHEQYEKSALLIKLACLAAALALALCMAAWRRTCRRPG